MLDFGMAEEGYVKFLVRFPAGLLAALREAARQNDRTLTGEIVHRLRNSLSEPRPDR